MDSYRESVFHTCIFSIVYPRFAYPVLVYLISCSVHAVVIFIVSEGWLKKQWMPLMKLIQVTWWKILEEQQLHSNYEQLHQNFFLLFFFFYDVHLCVRSGSRDQGGGPSGFFHQF